MKINSIEDVVSQQLCTGCGACAYIEPLRYKIVNVLDFGRRPFLIDNAREETTEALKVCPGIALTHSDDLRNDTKIVKKLLDGWGPVYGVWEGFSSDNEIRLAGSSGGAASALSLYCIESTEMTGVLHTAARSDMPYINETVMSTTREQLLARTGSRYSPASPAEKLDLIDKGSTQSVFIGKPCDIAAVCNVRKIRPELDKNIGLTIGFFCAGTPSTKGTLNLFKADGIDDPKAVKQLRYRGNGWPGMWSVRYINNKAEEETCNRTYANSWDFLQKYRQWRCYICPDHTAEFADIAVGDPWYRKVEPGEMGKSLIVARTQRGLDIIKAAEAAGYIVLEKNDSNLLPLSQPDLLATRGALWARLKVLRLFGAPVPQYQGFVLFKYWFLKLSLHEKLQSIVGTAKRVFKKQLNKPVEVHKHKNKLNL